MDFGNKYWQHQCLPGYANMIHIPVSEGESPQSLPFCAEPGQLQVRFFTVLNFFEGKLRGKSIRNWDQGYLLIEEY